MQNIFRILIISILGLALAACATPPAEENKNAGAVDQRSQPASDSSQPKVATDGTPPPMEGVGSIDVKSNPPGAQVILIEEDDAGAGAPKPRGVTPTTVTGLDAGKYTVHLELPGYKFYQKNVTVEANKTVKINAILKKG